MAFALALGDDPKLADKAQKQLQTLATAGDRSASHAMKYLSAREKTDVLLLDIPFVRQAKNYCAVASATMVLRHQGINVSQFEVQKLCGSKVGHGVYWPRIVAAAGRCKRKWKIEDYAVTDDGFAKAKAFALAELSANRPIIIDWYDPPNAHTVVLCGYDKKAREFYFRDAGLSFPGIHVRPEDQLKKMWATRGYIPNNRIIRRAMIRILPDQTAACPGGTTP